MGFANSSEALGLFLSKLRTRADLHAEEQQAVLKLPVSPRRIEAHREVAQIGNEIEHVSIIASGFVARFAQLEDGRRQLLSFQIPGDMLDLPSLVLSAAPSPILALAPTTIFQVPHAALEDLINRYPGLAKAFWRECVIDGNIVAQWLVSMGRMNARGRLAHLLCEMAVRYDRIGELRASSFPFPVTQEQLADALGLTSVHVNRSLKTLREEGVLRLSRSEAIILDWERLTALGEFDGAYLHLPPIAARTGQLEFGG